MVEDCDGRAVDDMYSRVGVGEDTTDGCCDGGNSRENDGNIVASDSTTVGCVVTDNDGRTLAACEVASFSCDGANDGGIEEADGNIEFDETVGMAEV